MKKFLLFTLMIIASASVAFAQTKKIAHRSHSGKGKVFHVHGDNLGLPPSSYPKQKIAVVDSGAPIILTDTTKATKPAATPAKPQKAATPAKPKKAAAPVKTEKGKTGNNEVKPAKPVDPQGKAKPQK